MSTLNPTKKVSRRQELRQDTVVTFYARAWEFVDRNRTIVLGAAAVVVLVVAALIGYAVYQQRQQAKAVAEMAGAVQAYEQGRYREALDGTAGYVGLLAIIDRYGGTEAGNLARFYAANAFFQLGEYDQALELFRDFEKEDNLIGASAVAGEAAVYEQRGEHERAARLYRRAAGMVRSEQVAADYLFDAARAYEAAGDYGAAREVYREIKDRYGDTPAARNVDVDLARVETLLKRARGT
ncbi:tetratricopeptide repeat protein [Rhodocaloribacter litoris]|uniref:tetratricopeptide repeat protein n=1 Tax=Rhodocaloribacter litoris TaxID=2558931 RepID=UPI00142011B3|nr:tetratricopeptide repeat protein [Rhodocaloribacter litoris]QXD15433.1 tetratricopeptide repeat protein [Rhodocaloribacter litoris]GIV60391.1 MAG: hypothetical protein KatS3mg043_1480 [Rhodothermaceae bacterium]